ncbi:MAG: metallophosphoesterase [Candidatus Woesearchaeota archaeon]
MDVATIVDYLVEKEEFVDEEIINKLKPILKLDSRKEIELELQIFFKKYFPDFDSSDFFKIFFSHKTDDRARCSILKSFEKSPSKRTVDDFIRYFVVRFRSIERFLRARPELNSLNSISRITGKKDREIVSLIGMVLEKEKTKNGHYILKMEDLSGTIKVLVNKDNEELIGIAEDIVLDEVVGIVGTSGGDIVFANKIVYPDIPLSKELKKSPFDHYAVFLGDIHIGSKEFLDDEFKKMILWINGKLGTPEQREVAKKVKYILLTGDLVEGVGIYPGQEEDLIVQNMEGQYNLLAEYLKKIPPHIKIIIAPGNHDSGRIAEPQLPIEKDYCSAILDLPNVIMVSNPAYVSLDVADGFSGIDVLMYHGYSLIYYSDNVPRIRAAGGQKAVDLIMKFLLKRRHLAPTHGSTLYVPDVYEDPLVIDPIPDIFVTGHIHRVSSVNYRNVTCLNTSCWTAITEDQEKRGLEPQPGRLVLVSLKTRDVKVMNFNATKDVKTVAEWKRLKKK